jgi:hypothetical protein
MECTSLPTTGCRTSLAQTGLDLLALANATHAPAIELTEFAHSEPDGEPGDSRDFEEIGVADRIQTHINWNHKGMIGGTKALKSNTSKAPARRNAHKKAR